jgi:glutamate-1-semialdehyde aminotransferase
MERAHLMRNAKVREEYSFNRSGELWQYAQTLIPGGSQGTRCPLYPEFPSYFASAKGCRMWDVDGNEFIDLLCSIGPIILGYAYDRVDDAACNIIRSSFQSSANHPVQLELAELLIQTIPCAEKVRFFKTGTEATMAAVRAARNHTGRNLIAQCGYHGWTDIWRTGGPGVDLAPSQSVRTFDGTAQGLAKLLKSSPEKFAAVMLCPVDTRPFTTGNFQAIVDTAHEHGAVVVFDEIKSGFRVALGGAQDYLHVTPDLTTLSKGMGNGYPIAAVVGKAGCMDSIEPTASIGTFSVEALAITAALETIRELKDLDAAPHLWRMGQRMIDGLNQICRDHGMREAIAYPDPVPSIFRFSWEPKKGNNSQHPAQQYFYSRCISYGLFFVPWHVSFICYSHTERDIDEALDICDLAMAQTAEMFG